MNAAGHFAQFWDGRAATVEAQALGPIVNPVEMGLTPAVAVARLKAVPEYLSEFALAFPGGQDAITFDHIGDAIGAFERTLLVPGRWDRFLLGDKSVLTAEETEGLRVFLNSGCMVCHTGQFLGGSMFERVGAVVPWPNTTDTGRMAVTGAAADRMMFKVPSLRNVEKTAPYFHDGSAPTLDIAVQMMGRHQLGVELEPQEIASIVAWLKVLTSEVPATLSARPRLPGDGRGLRQEGPRTARGHDMKRMSPFLAAVHMLLVAPVILPGCTNAAAATPPVGDSPVLPPDGSALACGASPLPLCPLQAWMRGEAAPAMRARDAGRLGSVFAATEHFGPSGYDQWVSFARAGKAAAEQGDLDAAQDACAGCHDAYRARYKAEMRSRRLP